MDQRLLFALIGALPGMVPAILLYLQRRKELDSAEPLGIMAATTAAETAMRIDLNKQIDGLRAEIKELKKENKELKKENQSLEKRVMELEKLSATVKNAWTEDQTHNR